MNINKNDAPLVGEYMNKLRTKITIAESRDFPLLSDYQSVNVYKLAELIATNSLVRMNFVNMIDQVPLYYSEKDTDGNYVHGYYLTSIDEMLGMLDHLITTTPEYNETGLVGFPINTILNWSMGTPAGSKAFAMKEVNEVFKLILNEWNTYLASPSSLGDSTSSAFNTTDGWCSPSALEKLGMEQFLNDADLALFVAGFDPNNPTSFPYQSWNEFFVRLFKDANQRPIDPLAKGIVSPCESNVFGIKDNAKLEDWFWVKSQPYSLQDLIGFPEPEISGMSKEEWFSERIYAFNGGTVWQAFLSATKYHRWNSPVDGTILHAYTLDGTYYDAAVTETMDPSSPDLSQGYISHTAVRSVFIIDVPNLGIIAFVAIGMSEVSTCRILPSIIAEIETTGYYNISRGEELGQFEYGGSTSCLIFPPNTIKSSDFLFSEGDDVKVGELIADYE